MLKFQILGSGSSGNSIYIEDGIRSFILDAGFSCSEILHRLDLVNIDRRTIKDLLISHEHSDHIKGANTLSNQLGLDIHMSGGTFQSCKDKIGKQVKIFRSGGKFSLGSIEVEPFIVSHDAAEPVGFVFRSAGVSLAVLTDLGRITEHVRYKVKDVDYLVIEANHDLSILHSNSKYPWRLRQRIASDRGHLSNEVSINFVKSLIGKNLKAVTFAHLSAKNNSDEIVSLMARSELEKRGIDFRIAKQSRPSEMVTVYRSSVRFAESFLTENRVDR